MAIIAGIDEAGLGPVLGPLVVSAAAFELPDELLDCSLWDLLAGAVSRKAARKSGKIAIGDSKKLYSRQKKNALEHLERAVLSAVAFDGDVTDSFGQLLSAVAPAAAEQLPHYPWYSQAELALPHCISATDVKLSANSLRSAALSAGVKLTALRSETVLVGQFNRHVAATNNKSTTLFDVASRLLYWLWRSYPTQKLRIVADRQGGRMRYLAPLQRVFDGCEFRVLTETEKLSAYRVSSGGQVAEIIFATGAEERHLPVALASMTSKYLRELFMAMFNRFWAAKVPGLAPTAGYYTDGRRFYKEIAPAVREMSIDSQLIYRSR